MALLSCSSSLEEDPRLAGQSWPRKSGLVGFTTQACPASLAASTRLVLVESASWGHHKGAQHSCKLWGVLKLPISRVTRLFSGGGCRGVIWLMLLGSLSLWLDSDFLTCTLFNGRRMGYQTLWFSIWNTEHFTVFCFKNNLHPFFLYIIRPYPSPVLENLAKAPSLCSSPELPFIRMSTPFMENAAVETCV